MTTAAPALFAPLARAATETVAFAFLDRAGAVLGLRHCGGSTLAVDLPVRAIAADALACEARRVVMAHNHPSGDAEPSRDDVLATRRLAAAFDGLGIRLVDHFVLAADGCTSFRARGLL